MAKQKAFFLSPEEIYRKDHPEAFEKKKRTRTSQPKKEKVYDCETCGLSSKCKHPKIKRYGKGRKKILLVGLCPGRTEDKDGIPFVGSSGWFLRKQLALLNIDIDQDCIRTNIVQCFPGLDARGGDKKPTNTQILCCASNLLRDIEETKPELIIALGTQAIQSLINTKGLSSFSASGTHGLTFPNQELQTWIGCSYHPSFFCRKKNEKGDKDDDIVFVNDLADIISFLGYPLSKPLTTEGNLLITNYKEAIDYIEFIRESKKPSCYDFETNSISCYVEEPKILTVALTNEIESAACIPIEFLQNGKTIFTESQLEKILDSFRKFLASDTPKIVQNYYMEELWGRNILRQAMNSFIHDTMVTAHVINCQTGTTSLGFQAYHLTGHDYKKMVDTKDLQKETIEEVANYNNWDVRYTLMSYYDQRAKLSIDPNKKKFNDWLTSCLPCLANLKDRGALIDQRVLNTLYDQYEGEKEKLLKEIKNLNKIREFESQKDKKEKNRIFNIDSSVHLEELIYSMWKEPKLRETEKIKRGATDEPALIELSEKTKNPKVKNFISSLLRYRKCNSLTKRVKTYRKFLDPNNRVHPTYNMNIAATYRSSANDPSVQNVFKHDKELQVFRKSIIPRPGNIILEVDYDGQEVRGIGMLSKDPVLAEQIIKSDKWPREHPGEINPWDTHRRWSGKVYSKQIKEITKDERYYGKNGFVFPSFYLSHWSSIARYEGFRGVSERHIQNVQEEFWEEYRKVKDWQKAQIDFYNKYGCYVGPLGNTRPGPLSYYQLANNIIQGLGFHLLLDALQKIDDEMIKREMESFAWLEVHDSIDFDCPPEEIDEVVELSTEILLSKRFDWQWEIPLSVTWEAGLNWYDVSEEYYKELVKV